MQAVLFAVAVWLASQVGLADEQFSPNAEEQVAPVHSNQLPVGEVGAATIFEDPDSGFSTPPPSDESSAPPASTIPENSPPAQEPLATGGATPLGSAEGLMQEAAPPTADAQYDPSTIADPATLLKSVSEPPADTSLTGTSLTLISALTGATTRREQTQRIEAYWELYQKVADHYLALKERTELAGLLRSVSNPSPEWASARERAESRVACSLASLRVAQQELAEFLKLSGQSFNVLPSDTPYCGPYKTRYEEIFRDRSSPLAASLDELLMRTNQSLSRQAQGVDRAREWMFAVSQRRLPQSDGNDLLMAYELFASRRRAFLETVRDYNRQIVRYTEVAAPGPVEPERLLAMLIRSENTAAGTFDTNVQRASGEQIQPPASFVPGSPNSWDSLPNNAERSILVPRR